METPSPSCAARATLDPDQLAAVTTDARRALVLAGAGSGKTRVLTERIAYLIEECNASPSEIVAVTFTRKAAAEMRERLVKRIGNKAYGVTMGTMHALALVQLKRFGELIGLRPDNITVYNEWEEDFLLRQVAQEVGALKGKTWKVPKKAVDAAFSTFYSTGIEPAGFDPACNLFNVFMARCRENNALTYGGLLTGFMLLLPQVVQYLGWRHVLVDEVQDLDTCHPPGTLVRKVIGQKSCRGNPYIFDDVPIETLKDGDRVVSWIRTHAILRPSGRAITIGKRHYEGDLLRVTCGDKSVLVTPDHKFYAIMNGNSEDSYAVYLMWKKELGFRVGICALRYCRETKHKPLNGAGSRFVEEGAEKGWILRIEKTRDQAAIWEQVISCNYGIPMVVFKENRRTNKETIDGIFSKTDGDGLKCLEDHGRSFAHPLFERNELDGGRKSPTKRYFETCAINLIPGIMSVPGVDRCSRVKVDSVERVPYSGDVYSMNVEGDHTYIADGIIVKNCQWGLIEAMAAQLPATLFAVGDSSQSIYAWRGAAPEYLLENADTFKVLRLARNYRSGRRIVDAANRLIEHNVARLPLRMKAAREDLLGSIPGGIEPAGNMDSKAIALDVESAFSATGLTYDLAVLARKHVLLQSVARELDALEIPYLYVGQKASLANSEEFRRFHAFLKLLVNPFDNFAFLLIKDALELSDGEFAAVRAMAIQNDKSHFQTWKETFGSEGWPLFYGRNGNDDALGVAIPVHSFLYGGQEIGGNSIVAFIHEWHLNTPPGKRTVSAYLEWLSTYDIQDEIPPADPDGPGVITLATIHGAKGLEWPYVILAGCNEGILPSDRAVKSGDLEEERRLAYVAITRARDCLTLAVRPERSEKPGRDGQMQVYVSPVSRFVAEAMGGGE